MILNSKILKVYELQGTYIEFVYEYDGIKHSFVIEKKCHFGAMYDGCWFDFGYVPLPNYLDGFKKELSKDFNDIDTILEINEYTKSHYYGAYTDLEIIYKDKSGIKKSYLIHPQPHEEEIYEIVVFKNRKSNFEFKKSYQNRQIPKDLFSTDVYKEALSFALKAHDEQKTPGGLPYIFHVANVANEVINSFGVEKIPYDEANAAISCALLHDVQEDTPWVVNRHNVDLPHIYSVMWGVDALTKDTSLPNKQEQMHKSLKALQNQPKFVQMVKLADRITNLAPAPLFWNKAKREAYVEEAKQILKALKGANSYLEQKLQDKIDNYKIDTIDNGLGIPTEDKFLVFFDKERQLVMDKNHKLYLKTFKAINRLNEYVKKEYGLVLFDDWRNRDEITLAKPQDRLRIDYIVKKLNTKDLLNIDKQIDEIIEKFMEVIYKGEGCIKQ